jgi:methylphosphotriester-DNA--protein-cysteine methyltransferase
MHGNKISKIYRLPSCPGYTGMNPASIVPFATAADAQHAGYRKAKHGP